MRQARRSEGALAARGRRGRAAAIVAVVLVALLAAGVAIPAPASAKARRPRAPWVPVATVDLVREDGTPAEGDLRNIFIDPRRDRAIVVGVTATAAARRAYFVDIDKPRQTGSVPLDYGAGNYRPLAFDGRSDRVFFGEIGVVGDVGCPVQAVSATPNLGTTVCGVSQGAPKRIKAMSLSAVDDAGVSVTEEFNLPPAYRGHGIASLSIDPSRNLLFAVTMYRGASNVNGYSEVVVHAIDLGTFPSADARIWSYPIRGCGALPGAGQSTRPFLGVGTTGDFLYTVCQDLVGQAVGAVTRPGFHSAAVIGFGGADPRIKGVEANFTTEHFPFAGDFALGFTFGDQAGDRVAAVVKGGGGERLYVFDALHRAWTGSVLLGGGNVRGGVIDVASGRAYTLDEKLGVVATDAAPVPVLQGTYRSIGGINKADHHPAFDPGTRRLFMAAGQYQKTDENGKVLTNTIEDDDLLVFEDRSEPYVEPLPVDPDALTNDIDEELASSVTHTGGGSGFGARALVVGGTRATPGLADVDRTVNWNPAIPVAGGSIDLTDLRPESGDRGLFLGRVVESQMTGSNQSGEAKATAVGAQLDEQTESDLDGKLGAPFNRAGSPPPEGLQWEQLKTTIGGLTEARCFDFGDPDDPRDGEESGASVSCAQREKVTASGTSSDAMATLPVQIGFASSDVELVLDEVDGIVSRSTAVARGVHIDVGVGSVSIGEVRSVATTQAKGRPGTAKSTFETTISNVRVVDSDGEGFSCAQCDPATVTQAINARFPSRVQAMPPRPSTDESVTGSPGGAQAVVIKDMYAYWSDVNVNGDSRKEVPGLQLVIYSDTKDASRTIIQLGAVFAESKYVVGDPEAEIDQDPASLTLELLDDAGAPLAGGVFELREDAGGGLGDCAPAGGDPHEGETTTTTDTTIADGSSTTTTPATTSTTAQPDEESRADGGDERSVTLPSLDDEGGEEDEEENEDAGGGFGDCSPPPEVVPEGETTTTTDTTIADDSSTATTTTGGTTTDDTTDETTTTTVGSSTTAVVDELTDALVADGTCVTAGDGIGDCIFEGLAPGSYIISQATAPAGYAPVGDFPVTLSPGMASTVSFTNLKALASITISLTDDATPPAPLAGGTFVVVADDADGVLGAADVELGRCTTGADGTCTPFVDVPLGAYVAHQESAPNGLLPAGDVAFALDQPGQVAALAFVNGAPPAAPSAASVESGGPAAATPSYGRATYIPPPPPPAPVVSSTLIPDPPSGLGRVLSLPTEAASFLARNPGEAALFAAVWSLLLAPAYLVARRRKLTLVKEI